MNAKEIQAKARQIIAQVAEDGRQGELDEVIYPAVLDGLRRRGASIQRPLEAITADPKKNPQREPGV